MDAVKTNELGIAKEDDGSIVVMRYLGKNRAKVEQTIKGAAAKAVSDLLDYVDELEAKLPHEEAGSEQ